MPASSSRSRTWPALAMRSPNTSTITSSLRSEMREPCTSADRSSAPRMSGSNWRGSATSEKRMRRRPSLRRWRSATSRAASRTKPNAVAVSATGIAPMPHAMPMPIMRNMTPASRGSLMPERKRMKPPRPTSANASATLLPMTAVMRPPETAMSTCAPLSGRSKCHRMRRRHGRNATSAPSPAATAMRPTMTPSTTMSKFSNPRCRKRHQLAGLGEVVRHQAVILRPLVGGFSDRDIPCCARRWLRSPRASPRIHCTTVPDRDRESGCPADGARQRCTAGRRQSASRERRATSADRASRRRAHAVTCARRSRYSQFGSGDECGCYKRAPMRRRRGSLFAGLVSLSLALAGVAGCGDNLAAEGGGGTEADAGPAEPDAGGEPDAAPTGIVTCEEAVPAASEGACDVTPGDGTAVLLRGTVLGRDVVYENGAVLYDGASIVCVGCNCGDEQQAVRGDPGRLRRRGDLAGPHQPARPHHLHRGRPDRSR